MYKLKTKRDWGDFFTLFSFKNIKLKLLRLDTNKAIHLQYHKYRSEIWFALSGKGLVQVGSYKCVIQAGSYVYIPKEVVHKVWSLDDTLTIAELQLGSKVIEEDIVHLD